MYTQYISGSFDILRKEYFMGLFGFGKKKKTEDTVSDVTKEKVKNVIDIDRNEKNAASKEVEDAATTVSTEEPTEETYEQTVYTMEDDPEGNTDVMVSDIEPNGDAIDTINNEDDEIAPAFSSEKRVWGLLQNVCHSYPEGTINGCICIDKGKKLIYSFIFGEVPDGTWLTELNDWIYANIPNDIKYDRLIEYWDAERVNTELMPYISQS